MADEGRILEQLRIRELEHVGVDGIQLIERCLEDREYRELLVVAGDPAEDWSVEATLRQQGGSDEVRLRPG